MLWIAIHLPALSLESFAATLDRDVATRPVALIDDHRVAAANAAARALGVRAGLKRATALALSPQIVLGQADPARDAAALLPLAHTALAWTPMVCLQPGRDGSGADTVLLEVQASLRCFGGLAALVRRIEAALAPLGHAFRIATAATAQGAAVLARIDPPPRCVDLASTRVALEKAPVWLFGPGREHWEALQGMGLRILEDLLVLPRAGLARRFGEALLDEIDAALGARPDPREAIVVAPSFASRLELFARADTTEQVLHGASVLLGRLVAWLAAQHARTRGFELVMRHERRWRSSDRTPQATSLDVALAEPSRDRSHLLVLLRERLAQATLPAPTLELELHAADIVRGAPPSGELFATAGNEREGLVRLVERLQARLGREHVCRLVEVEDHRPERASVLAPVDAGVADDRARSRHPQRGDDGALPHPVWLLPAPEPLAESGSRPLWRDRPLVLLSGPERIETGWWDEALAGRDYFIADAGDGALVWIFRERLPASGGHAGWYLHGRFG